MNKAMRAGLLTAVVLSTAVGTAATATAASEKSVFDIACSNGTTYTVATNGNGDYTPARVVGSTTVLVPVAFGEFSGTVTYPDGTVEDFTEPASAKRGTHKADLTCSFSFSGTDGGITFAGSGSVAVTVSGHR